MKSSFIYPILAIMLILGACSQSQESRIYKLNYDAPATYFEEAFVLGNGMMGATVFGGLGIDTIFLNDMTLWSGEPVDPYMNPEAYKYMPEIREALFSEDYAKADELNKKLQGAFSHSFAPLGNLLIEFGHEEDVSAYRRELNISDAKASVAYHSGDIKYSREYFVSNPDQLMLIKLTSDKEQALDFKLDFSSLLQYDVVVDESTITANGYAPYYAAPSYLGKVPDAVLFDEDRATRFTAIIELRECDGEITLSDSGIVVSGASDAVVAVSVATSFNGFDKDPATEGKNSLALANRKLMKASSKTYDELKMRHREDYHSFFNRMELELGEQMDSDLTTDDRLKAYFTSRDDLGLEELYFHYVRYLMISASRTSEVPMNLQGIWNQHMRPPWSSNYTVNINVEENYWLAEQANLSELHEPLLSFIENLAETGAITAKTFYGVDKGWCVAHNSDIWAMSNPVGNFGEGHPVWANWNMGGVWLSTHLWEHFAFTLDTLFLKNTGYPLMKGAANFAMEWLVDDGHGHLVPAPSTSPENIYIADDYRGATLYGGTADLAMIRELLMQTKHAAEVVGEEEAFMQQLGSTLDKLYPYQVGSAGNLQEWYHDWSDADPKHRHQSHLFGLYPGHHITPELSPELAAACEHTLNVKGDMSTGWSQGWRINLWARLKDGNRAHKLYSELLAYVDPSGTETNYSKGGGTYPNLLDAHPPYQIDGNFGGASGVLEMLVRSAWKAGAEHESMGAEEQESRGEWAIELLPALPDVWPKGSVSGVKARGGFELSFTWEDHRVKACQVYSGKGGKSILNINGEEIVVELGPGETRALKLK